MRRISLHRFNSGIFVSEFAAAEQSILFVLLASVVGYGQTCNAKWRETWVSSWINPRNQP